MDDIKEFSTRKIFLKIFGFINNKIAPYTKYYNYNFNTLHTDSRKCHFTTAL